METEDDIVEIEEVLAKLGLAIAYGDAPEWLLELARSLITGDTHGQRAD